MSAERRIGAAITLGVALLAAIALLVGHIPSSIAGGIAVAGILIGTGVAKGKFSRTQDAGKKN